MNVINLFGGWVETVFILLIGLSIINREIRLHYKIEIYIIGLYGSFLLLILQDVSTLYFSLLFLIITLVIVINSFMGIKLSNAFFAVIVGASFLLVAENISIVFYHLLINFSQHNILINEEFRFYFIFIFTLFLLFNSYLLSLKLNTRFIIEFRFISKEKDNRVIQIGILIAFILTLITFILLVDVNQGRNMIVFGFVIATISSISFTHKIFQKKLKIIEKRFINYMMMKLKDIPLLLMHKNMIRYTILMPYKGCWCKKSMMNAKNLLMIY
ncbi:hypothetical protein HXA31_17185 [Salipaludibacillus agaradhaerens]|uniref:hypothetical protein n=1 Tax=Salipaludibacillus agaradhaerens TaxID=76935 RepID=UPI0021507616|nr:hypothetical protein [Salipaludibacillus agaradhaerens]MCR6116075.1 hypothetical protein [Salipaludibacillus agaradhaerens]